MQKPPKNSTKVTKLISKILPYSAKAIKAKPNPPYSTLYPETNSDSPSTKSNGARLVSAKTQINQITRTSIEIKPKINPLSRKEKISKHPKKSKGQIRTVDITSS